MATHTTTLAVELQNVTKNYGSALALKGISLKVEPGEVVAILGPNGAGKSTSIALMLGMRRPSSGSVTLFGLMLLLSFASGLFVPLSLLPDLLQKIAPFLPTYQLGQLAWITVGSSYNSDDKPLWVHLLILLAYAAVFAVLASWAYIRDENKNFA